MKFNYFLIIFLFMFSAFSFAEEASPLAKKIDQLLSDFGENINIGIDVQDAKTGQILYQKNIDRYFTPASNQKLFTAFAALESLGPEFKYRTQLFVDYTKIRKGKLNDNLYLQFSGDPSLTFNQFDQLVSSLAEVGLLEIKGKIIVDDSAFDQMTMSPGSSWDDQSFCWGSPISALIINRNCVTAKLQPAAQVNQVAELELPTYPQSVQFDNQVLTASDSSKDCRIKIKRQDEKTYRLEGCLKQGANPHLVERAINNPRENLGLLLNYLLEKNRIKYNEPIEFKAFSNPQKPFALQESPPLKTLVATMLKESDNTISEALFKTMGAYYTKQEGSFRNGNKAVRHILVEKAKFKFPQTMFIDGSGLSRYNFLTPKQIVNLLQKIYLKPDANAFIASLAIAGMDGTLKDRLKGSLTLGKIQAKTGSETGVTALSGFLETANNHRLIFSIIINGYVGPDAKYKALVDKICLLLAQS